VAVASERKADAPVIRRSAGRQSLPARPAGRCACGGGCPTCRTGLQAKLAIGPVNDPLEREADHIAGLVTAPGAPGSPVQTSSASSYPLQRQANGVATPESAPPSVATVLRSSGQSLPDSVRHEFEPRFGHDFSSVRVHADPMAAQSAAAVQALAYTVGRDIVFGAGQFRPESASGRRLIAHELTHVVQQGGNDTPIIRRQTDTAAKPSAIPVSEDEIAWWIQNNPDKVAELSKSSFMFAGGLRAAITEEVRKAKKAAALTGGRLPVARPTPPSKPTAWAPPEKEPMYWTATAEPAAKSAGGEAATPSSGPNLWNILGGGLLGEWNEDPSFAMIATDTAVSLVPVLDQVSDARDLSAHLYYMIEKDQYAKPMRWVGLCFSLIGLFPEIGSAIKSASKFVLKGIREALSHLDDLFRVVKRLAPDLSDLQKLGGFVEGNWGRFVVFGKRMWEQFLNYILKSLPVDLDLLRISGITSALGGKFDRIADRLSEIRKISSSSLDGAFTWARKQWDEGLRYLGERFGRKLESETSEWELESAQETASRLTQEAHPDWSLRKGSTRPAPKTTRTEPPLRSLGYDKRAPGPRTYSRARPPLESMQQTLAKLMNIEGHHSWPKYLDGLVDQSLLYITRMEHQKVHRALEQWKGGLLAPWKGLYKKLSLAEVLSELEDFYTHHFPEYLETFRNAAQETLDAILKDVSP
jgi:hypothetical protein